MCSAGSLCCFFIILMSGQYIQAEPTLDRGPQDATVRQGATVNFTCDLANIDGYTVYWHQQPRGGSGRYLTVNRDTHPDLPPPPELEQRLLITGDESRGEFTLQISNVQ